MHRPLPQMDGSWCHSSRVDQETSYANACGTGHVTDAQGEELSHSTSPCFQESLESTNLANRPPGHCKGVACQPLERLPCMQQQARSRRFAVFSPKRAQRRSVSHSRSRRCLDFDGQEAATGLDYKIHLLAGCRSPIQNFRRLGPSITPAHEILEYDVFEVRATRFGNAG